jgi:hypothetical protein
MDHYAFIHGSKPTFVSLIIRAQTLLLFFFFILSCSTTPQIPDVKENYFEGNIRYKNEYHIKTSKISAADLDKIFGKTADLFFNEGDYLEVYDGGFMLQQLYM